MLQPTRTLLFLLSFLFIICFHYYLLFYLHCYLLYYLHYYFYNVNNTTFNQGIQKITRVTKFQASCNLDCNLVFLAVLVKNCLSLQVLFIKEHRKSREGSRIRIRINPQSPFKPSPTKSTLP